MKSGPQGTQPQKAEQKNSAGTWVMLLPLYFLVFNLGFAVGFGVTVLIVGLLRVIL